MAEACRNIAAVGAEPVAMVDHLQFGDPSDPDVFWSFSQTLKGMSAYCSSFGLPIVGGKVSFYNEDEVTGSPIKPSPIAMVVGVAPTASVDVRSSYREADEAVFLLGRTDRELGGSEYFETVLGVHGGTVPLPHPETDAVACKTVFDLVSRGLVRSARDCSKGGLGVALAEMSAGSGLGASIDLKGLAPSKLKTTELLYSESHGRFVLSTADEDAVEGELAASGLPYCKLGTTGGTSLVVRSGPRRLVVLEVTRLARMWEKSIPGLLN